MKDENFDIIENKEKRNEKIFSIILVIIAVLAFGFLGVHEIVFLNRFDEKTEFLNSILVKTWGEDVTKINDSTYHINLSDGMCTTFQKSYDTLKVDAVGISWMKADLSKDDKIRIYGISNDGEEYMGKKYRNLEFYLNYHDYFDNDVNFVKFQAGIQYGDKNGDTASFINI